MTALTAYPTACIRRICQISKYRPTFLFLMSCDRIGQTIHRRLLILERSWLQYYQYHFPIGQVLEIVQQLGDSMCAGACMVCLHLRGPRWSNKQL